MVLFGDDGQTTIMMMMMAEMDYLSVFDNLHYMPQIDNLFETHCILNNVYNFYLVQRVHFSS